VHRRPRRGPVGIRQLPWRRLVNPYRPETAFYTPLVSDWRNFETWTADGSRTATQGANSLWKRLLAEAAPPPLDPLLAEALDAFVERRKREIAAGW
jgi:trimethylamine--corrinoid protein Co-methyltransferase